MELIKNPYSYVDFGNNIEYMMGFPDKYFDLLEADPPYGIGAEVGQNRAARKMFKERKGDNWDSKIPPKEYFEESKRISKNQVYWGGNYYLDYLGATRCFFVWDKLNPGRDFADAELAWTSLDKVVRIFNPKRVQELNKYEGGKIHPHQKPVALYHWQYKQCDLKEGMKVYSSHVGSGSCRIAAHLLGLEFHGSEISDHYHPEQEARFKQYLASYGMIPLEEQQIDETFKLD